MLSERINKDLKAAMLEGDTLRVNTLKSLKNAIQYAAVAKLSSEMLSDEELQSVLSKESKKREESAQLYKEGGSTDRAETELKEKAIIDEYLPPRLSDEKILEIIRTVVEAEGEAVGPASIGRIIGLVKARAESQADGAKIAELVKKTLG